LKVEKVVKLEVSTISLLLGCLGGFPIGRVEKPSLEVFAGEPPVFGGEPPGSVLDGGGGAVLRGRLPNRGLGSPIKLLVSTCMLSRLSVLESFLATSVPLLLVLCLGELAFASTCVGGGGARRLVLGLLLLIERLLF